MKDPQILTASLDLTAEQIAKLAKVCVQIQPAQNLMDPNNLLNAKILTADLNKTAEQIAKLAELVQTWNPEEFAAKLRSKNPFPITISLLDL